ncbi:hypothetical protein IWQ62_003109 [Dispira parvispora]|uniref:UDENN domain-containing protein n=1 Tax=Dispira parvispora TaxID=1520584 RepID=A0A9W8AUK6_9FUNG|nr:hypothetical protein IWQ62_003109 [Dispira parvispora]
MRNVLSTHVNGKSTTLAPTVTVTPLSYSPRGYIAGGDAALHPVQRSASYHQRSPNRSASPSLSTGSRKLGTALLQQRSDTSPRDLTTAHLSESMQTRFYTWCLALCVVNFDLDYGPTIDSVYPPHAFSSEEAKIVAFSSFPDSAICGLCEIVFTFRIRLTSPQPPTITPAQPNSASSPPTTGFYYGYVFFRQKKDPYLRRGCFQKSLVLLSPLPYHGLFSKLVRILGPLYFDLGHVVLESAVHIIGNEWPSPFTGDKQPLSATPAEAVEGEAEGTDAGTSSSSNTDTGSSCTPPPFRRTTTHPSEGAGKLVELPFFGHTLLVELPTHSGHQLLETCAFDMSRINPSRHVLATVPLDGLFTTFREMLSDLWKCWEIMMVAEPLVVLADSPDTCSQAVLALVDLIQPITYCGDVRPYFTIQDSDFKSYVSKNRIPSNVLLGVSNPFFDQALAHWPHIIRLHSPRQSNGKKSHRMSSFQLQRNWLTSEIKHGLRTKRKSIVGKDRALSDKITTAAEAGYTSPYILNNLLRRHFLDLTEKFLAPLNRYFSTLIPKVVDMGTVKERPKLKPFNRDDFFKSLAEHGSQIPIKNSFGSSVDYVAFYRQFLNCGNFATWLQYRTAQAEVELEKRYCQVLCATDMYSWAKGRPESEIVDLLVILRAEIRVLGAQQTDSLHHLGTSPQHFNSARTVSTPNSVLKHNTLAKLAQQTDILLDYLSPQARCTAPVDNDTL